MYAVELQVTSNYSFLRGGSHVEELMLQARALGYDAIAVTDRNSLAGIARAHHRASELGIRLVVGVRLDLRDAPSLLVYPTDRAAYARLCRLLSRGKGRAGKGGCDLSWSDLAELSDGLLAVLLPERPLEALDDALPAELDRLRAVFGDRAWCALTLERRPNDRARLHRTAALCRAAGVAAVATGDVLYHVPDRRILQDVVTCIREGCTIDAAGYRRARSVDRHLKGPGEMDRLFGDHPEALAATHTILERCRFSLSELSYRYPEESETPGLSDQEDLERLVRERLPVAYPDGVPDAVTAQVAHELGLIRELDYAPYFLTVNAIVRFARQKGILCQGRGSAANSAVCFVLGITAIDPVESNLLFERFISTSRREPPDIDVDFEHERREEVIQWVYQHYGRDPRRAVRHGDAVSRARRGARRGQGDGPDGRRDRQPWPTQVWGWSGRSGVERGPRGGARTSTSLIGDCA